MDFIDLITLAVTVIAPVISALIPRAQAGSLPPINIVNSPGARVTIHHDKGDANG